MAITSESQMIDVTTISNGCTIIEEAANDYIKCAEKVKEAAAICTAEALSVEKKSMQPALEELGEAIKTVETNIVSFAKEIRNIAVKIQGKQYEELAQYQADKIARENAANNYSGTTTTTTN